MFEITKSAHNCSCRLCNRIISKNSENMIRIEAHRSKASLFICDRCVDDMKSRIDWVKSEEEKESFEDSKCDLCGNIGFKLEGMFVNANDDEVNYYSCIKCGYEIS